MNTLPFSDTCQVKRRDVTNSFGFKIPDFYTEMAEAPNEKPNERNPEQADEELDGKFKLSLKKDHKRDDLADKQREAVKLPVLVEAPMRNSRDASQLRCTGEHSHPIVPF